MNKSNIPILKTPWSRFYKIHVKTLFHAIKSKEDLKLFAFYLNLHSYYKEKTFHKYKSRYQELAAITGCSDAIFRKNLNLLFKRKLCRDWNGNLVLVSLEKFSDQYKLTDDLYDGLKYYQTKFVRFETPLPLSIYNLESLSLELKLDQKRFGLTQSLCSSDIRKTIMSKRFLLEAKLKSSLASMPSATNTNLFLNDIKQMFGLTTNQGASYKIQKLVNEGLITVKQQLRFVRRVKNKMNMRLSPKTFIKGNWVMEQLPNVISFVKSPISKSWWSKIIEKHDAVFMKAKAEKIKSQSNIRIKTLVNKEYNKQARASFNALLKKRRDDSEVADFVSNFNVTSSYLSIGKLLN